MNLPKLSPQQITSFQNLAGQGKWLSPLAALVLEMNADRPTENLQTTSNPTSSVESTKQTSPLYDAVFNQVEPGALEPNVQELQTSSPLEKLQQHLQNSYSSGTLPLFWEDILNPYFK